MAHEAVTRHAPFPPRAGSASSTPEAGGVLSAFGRAKPARSPWWWVRTISPVVWACLVMLTVFVICGVFAGLIAPHDPAQNDLRARLQPPAFSEGGSTVHLLGTDQLGRDLLSRLTDGYWSFLAQWIATSEGDELIGKWFVWSDDGYSRHSDDIYRSLAGKKLRRQANHGIYALFDPNEPHIPRHPKTGLDGSTSGRVLVGDVVLAPAIVECPQCHFHNRAGISSRCLCPFAARCRYLP